MKKEEKVDINCMKYPNCKFCPKNENCEKDKENKIKIERKHKTSQK